MIHRAIAYLSNPRGFFVVVSTAIFAVLFISLALAFFSTGRSSAQDLWLTTDQQAQWSFSRGRYRQAALRFNNPHWKALAYYAAEDFRSAEIHWSRQSGSQALFNRGNALAHQRLYDSAADSYRLALSLKPDWQAAQENLQLVLALSVEAQLDVERNAGQAHFAADEVVFDEAGPPRNDFAANELGNPGPLSAEEIQALWMRRLDSKPIDFLRLKFRYQQAQAEQQ